jgi:4-aminobutyrate aminotransferase
MDWEGGSHASTFGGNPVSCAAASAAIDVIQNEGLRENAAKQGAYVMKRLEELKERSEIVGDVRGKGLMIGIELVEDKKSKKPASKKAEGVMMQSWKRGVAVITCGKSTIRIAPPLIITRELVDSGLDIIEDAIKHVEKQG